MGNPTNREQIGGQIIHVGDCYVWATIAYLDSPTDYRESLPANSIQPRVFQGEDLVLLDDLAPSRRNGPRYASLWTVLFLFLIIAWFLLEIVLGFESSV
jgi:hypothetical protein